MGKYDKILNLLMKYSNLGIEENIHTGAILIGHAPHIAPHAFLNQLFPPIDMEKIHILENDIGNKMPDSYVEFLTKFSNGLHILVGVLSLFGYRTNYVRRLGYCNQPFDIRPINTIEKPHNASIDMFFMGFYDWDGSSLYMTPDGKVQLCRRYDATCLHTWESLEDMLISEIERLYGLYDENGVKINPIAPTTPL
ncbi:MAG: SMI1/KNR4 family protein [Clostridium sp.]|nr:SMI1/KNR4 family protein [Clostridium sp.]